MLAAHVKIVMQGGLLSPAHNHVPNVPLAQHLLLAPHHALQSHALQANFSTALRARIAQQERTQQVEPILVQTVLLEPTNRILAPIVQHTVIKALPEPISLLLDRHRT